MGFKSKRSLLNRKLVFGLFFLLFLSYFYQQWRSSLILTEKNRLNIAVFSEVPFVYTLNVPKNFAVITYFNPNFLVEVPGGYKWYRVGSLNLLGKIENKREEILRQSFSQLIGAPIDLIVYPKQAVASSETKVSFPEFYDGLVKNRLFSRHFRIATNNFFDRLLTYKAFQVRQDHLLYIDTTDLGVLQKGKTYYYPEKLDSRLKGLFYDDGFLNQALKAVIVTDRDNYSRAQQQLRQLEGIGIKVIDIEITKKLKNRRCVIAYSRQHRSALSKLKRLFSCETKLQNSNIIRYTVSR